MSLLIGAMLAAGVPTGAPIQLVAQEEASGVRIAVTGLSDSDVRASYTLETRAGTNHSRQSGRAALVAGKPASLLTVALGGPSRGWSATLTVEPEGAAPYSVQLEGPQPAR